MIKKFNVKKFIEIRKKTGLSQYAFAMKVRVSKQAINLIEHGVSKSPETATLLKITEHIPGVKLEDFFS